MLLTVLDVYFYNEAAQAAQSVRFAEQATARPPSVSHGGWHAEVWNRRWLLGACPADVVRCLPLAASCSVDAACRLPLFFGLPHCTNVMPLVSHKEEGLAGRRRGSLIFSKASHVPGAHSVISSRQLSRRPSNEDKEPLTSLFGPGTALTCYALRAKSHLCTNVCSATHRELEGLWD
jgi:hypothetical protein